MCLTCSVSFDTVQNHAPAAWLSLSRLPANLTDAPIAIEPESVLVKNERTALWPEVAHDRAGIRFRAVKRPVRDRGPRWYAHDACDNRQNKNAYSSDSPLHKVFLSLKSTTPNLNIFDPLNHPITRGSDR